MTIGLLLLLAQLEDAPAPGPDPARLERAAALLGPARREGALGPWRLFTDLADSPALRELASVAARLPEAYRARFGLDAEARPREAVVLFAREESYLAFAGDRQELGTKATPGHAGGGLAAAAAGAALGETRPVVVHELSHLLTQEAFARPAPPWIEEGLSEDLGWCRVDKDGRLLFGTLEVASSTRYVGDTVRRTTAGPRATVDGFAVHARAGRVPTLSALLEPGTKLFSEPGTRRDAYTEAGLLVRFLLGRDSGRAERFRVFLRAAALGAPAGLEDLAAALGTSSTELEKEYVRFLRGL
jgi:hypothetical protein